MKKSNPDIKERRAEVALGDGELRGVEVEGSIKDMGLGSDIDRDVMTSFELNEVVLIGSMVVISRW